MKNSAEITQPKGSRSLFKCSPHLFAERIPIVLYLALTFVL